MAEVSGLILDAIFGRGFSAETIILDLLSNRDLLEFRAASSRAREIVATAALETRTFTFRGRRRLHDTHSDHGPRHHRTADNQIMEVNCFAQAAAWRSAFQGTAPKARVEISNADGLHHPTGGRRFYSLFSAATRIAVDGATALDDACLSLFTNVQELELEWSGYGAGTASQVKGSGLASLHHLRRLRLSDTRDRSMQLLRPSFDWKNVQQAGETLQTVCLFDFAAVPVTLLRGLTSLRRLEMTRCTLVDIDTHPRRDENDDDALQQQDDDQQQPNGDTGAPDVAVKLVHPGNLTEVCLDTVKGPIWRLLTFGTRKSGTCNGQAAADVPHMHAHANRATESHQDEGDCGSSNGNRAVSSNNGRSSNPAIQTLLMVDCPPLERGALKQQLPNLKSLYFEVLDSRPLWPSLALDVLSHPTLQHFTVASNTAKIRMSNYDVGSDRQRAYWSQLTEMLHRDGARATSASSSAAPLLANMYTHHPDPASPLFSFEAPPPTLSPQPASTDAYAPSLSSAAGSSSSPFLLASRSWFLARTHSSVCNVMSRTSSAGVVAVYSKV